jgi:hypothetical protein
MAHEQKGLKPGSGSSRYSATIVRAMQVKEYPQ